MASMPFRGIGKKNVIFLSSQRSTKYTYIGRALINGYLVFPEMAFPIFTRIERAPLNLKSYFQFRTMALKNLFELLRALNNNIRYCAR
jgi:hypothetical protein